MSDKGVSGRENMQKRLKDAQQLLGDILTDKPQLPPELPVRERSPRRKKSKSPPRERTTLKTSPVRDRSPKVSSFRPVHSPKVSGTQAVYRQTSPKRQQTVRISSEVQEREYDDIILQDHEEMKKQYSVQPVRRAVSPKTPGRLVPRLKLIDSDDYMQRTAETTGEKVQVFGNFLMAEPLYQHH